MQKTLNSKSQFGHWKKVHPLPSTTSGHRQKRELISIQNSKRSSCFLCSRQRTSYCCDYWVGRHSMNLQELEMQKARKDEWYFRTKNCKKNFKKGKEKTNFQSEPWIYSVFWLVAKGANLKHNYITCVWNYSAWMWVFRLSVASYITLSTSISFLFVKWGG